MGISITSALVTLLLGTQVVVNFDIYRRADPEPLSDDLKSKTEDVVETPQPADKAVELVVEPSLALSLTSVFIIGCVGLLFGLAVGTLWCAKSPPAVSSFRPVRIVRDGSGNRAPEAPSTRFTHRGHYGDLADGFPRAGAPVADHWY